MPIFIDRVCLEHLIDVLEGNKKVTDEAIIAIIKQGRRLIQVDKDKESGKLCGRPKKKKAETLDFDFQD